MSSWRCLVAAALGIGALAGAAVGQRRVWIVDQRGGGDFRQIDSAVHAASPGDRVEVRGALQYLYFTLDKGLDLEAVEGASVDPSVVRDIPAGQWARVAGFRVNGPTSATPTIPNFAVERCAGPVLLHSLAITDPRSTGLSVSGSGAVLVLRSSVVPSSELLGSTGVRVVQSRVTFQDCQCAGGNGLYALGPINPRPASPGGPGLVAGASEVFAFRSAFRGGQGGAGWVTIGCVFSPAPGGDGVRIDTAGLFFGRCTLAGGAAGYGPNCPPPPASSAVAGLGATVRVTSDSAITGVLRNVAVIPPLTSLTSPGTAQQGTQATLTLTGPPGTGVMVLADAVHAHQPLPGIDGPYLLSPAPAPIVLLFTGASGTAPFLVDIPVDPQLASQFVLFQGVAFPPGAPWPSLTGLGELRIR